MLRFDSNGSKEMALKFCAHSGESDFSALGVLSAMICEREILFDVEPECFNPPPKVVSAVMKMINSELIRISVKFMLLKLF